MATGTGFTIAQLSLLVNASIGIWAFHVPKPGTPEARKVLVEGAREYVRHTAVRRSDQLTTHHYGEADHLAWLDRPFAEAPRALEERGPG